MEIIQHICHPDEVYALMKFKLGFFPTSLPQSDLKVMSDNLQKCYHFLTQTSRSFAAVIQVLDEEIRDAVCIFYLVLRALDTVEDDVTIPNETKIPMLINFYKNLDEPEWCFMDSQEKDRAVLQQFPVISSEYQRLKPVYREIIQDTCKKMGKGMTVYLDKAPDTKKDWDEYCHYVAGLVGIGLSSIFSVSRLEDRVIGQETGLSNSLGLFLQKTNIIRDFLEDVTQGRDFWPKAAWEKYVDKPLDLLRLEKRREAVECLNGLVTNALQHVPDVLKYLSCLKNKSVFNFCAIPQVMAMATLERCYNNPKVFTGVVKIRKGEAVKMMISMNNLESVKTVMKHFLKRIKSRIPYKDQSAKSTHTIVDFCLSVNRTQEEFVSSSAFFPLYMSFAIMVGAVVWQYYHGIYSWTGKFSAS